ncbi:hypothetical protein N8843_09715 [Verrucomicrobia bacterium]|nr:hypothetical protein [Verrucomicrobiota bacterium]
MQNKRLKDARGFLAGIGPHSLSEDFRPSFDLAIFELYCLESNWDQARDVLRTMKREKLLPPQQVWLADIVKHHQLFVQPDPSG